MKILSLVLCLAIFTSCAKTNEAFIELPIERKVKFDDRELKVEGTLFYDKGKMIFLPDTPDGYKITVTENGGQVEFEGLVFDKNVLPSSRFLPLFELLEENLNKESTHLKIKKKEKSINKDHIKLTFN